MSEAKKYKELYSNIFWVGSGISNNGLNFNPYLLIDQDEAVLIDPGPMFDFQNIYSNVIQLIEISKIKYVVLQNFAPTVCSSLSLWIAKGLKAKIITHERAEVNLRSYGVDNEIVVVNELNSQHQLKSGRILNFIETPYLPYIESIVTYDSLSKILFSSFLFGATPRKWNFFADKIFYKESMKSFHETLIPENQFLRAVINYFMKMEISLIAPFYGSIINDDPQRFLKILLKQECGVFFNPIKFDITRKEGFISICNEVLKKLYSKLDKFEVVEVFNNTEIILDEHSKLIHKFEGSGEELWDKFFSIIFTKKGSRWLISIQDEIDIFIKKYNLSKPSIFLQRENEIIKLDEENVKLKEINERLEKTKQKLTSCPITKLRNEIFCWNYLSEEIENHIENSANFIFLLIAIDDFSQIRIKHRERGKEIIEKTLKTTTYILEQIKNKTDLIFRFSDNLFSYFISDSDMESGIAKAELIRNSIVKSELYFEKTTVSIGVISLSELLREEQNPEDLILLAKQKVKEAAIQGGNFVFSGQAQKLEYHKPKLLVVEHDIMILEILTLHLVELNYDVLTCDDGDQAIKLIEKHLPDIVISELMLPKHNAFVIRENMLLNSNQKKIPLILLSHQKDEQTIKQALDLGINHYFKKPFVLSELVGLIENICAL